MGALVHGVSDLRLLLGGLGLEALRELVAPSVDGRGSRGRESDEAVGLRRQR